MKTIYRTSIGTIFVDNDGEIGWQILLTPPSGREKDLQVLCNIYPDAFDENGVWRHVALAEIRDVLVNHIPCPITIVDDKAVLEIDGQLVADPFRLVCKIHRACFKENSWIPEIHATLIDIFEKPDTLEIE